MSKYRLSKDIEENDSDNYIDTIKEWNNHQYDPGYYAGGKIPPYIKKPGNPKILGIILIISGFLVGGILFIAISSSSASYDGRHLIEMILMILSSIFFGGYAVISIIGGFRLLNKAGSRKRVKLKKKKLHKEEVK